jgi:hypothetical protein
MNNVNPATRPGRRPAAQAAPMPAAPLVGLPHVGRPSTRFRIHQFRASHPGNRRPSPASASRWPAPRAPAASRRLRWRRWEARPQHRRRLLRPACLQPSCKNADRRILGFRAFRGSRRRPRDARRAMKAHCGERFVGPILDGGRETETVPSGAPVAPVAGNHFGRPIWESVNRGSAWRHRARRRAWPGFGL